MDITRKNKLLENIYNNLFSNDILLMMTDYFNTNIILYYVDTNIVKLYYT